VDKEEEKAMEMIADLGLRLPKVHDRCRLFADTTDGDRNFTFLYSVQGPVILRLDHLHPCDLYCIWRLTQKNMDVGNATSQTGS